MPNATDVHSLEETGGEASEILKLLRTIMNEIVGSR